jgi:hypothetical protein
MQLSLGNGVWLLGCARRQSAYRFQLVAQLADRQETGWFGPRLDDRAGRGDDPVALRLEFAEPLACAAELLVDGHPLSTRTRLLAAPSLVVGKRLANLL